MSPRARRTAAVVTSAVLIGGGGVAAAAAASGPAKTRSKQEAPSGSAYGDGSGYGGPGFGPGGRGPSRGGLPSNALAEVAKTLGVTTDQLRSAVESARSAAAPDDPRGALVDELAAALNVDAAKIESVLQANRPARPSVGDGPGAGRLGPRGGHPDGGRPPSHDSALVAALAKGLSIDEATVKAAFEKVAAAHEADHAKRKAAFFGAVATSLGLDTAAVEKAFEAARP